MGTDPHDCVGRGPSASQDSMEQQLVAEGDGLAGAGLPMEPLYFRPHGSQGPTGSPQSPLWLQPFPQGFCESSPLAAARCAFQPFCPLHTPMQTFCWPGTMPESLACGTISKFQSN